MRRVAAGELDLELADAWLQRLLREQGADIFRMKGVLAIAHAQKAFVFHAVHMHFEGSFSQEWADGEPRRSKLVFIGKNLDGAALACGFDACIATPENLRAKAAALRFAVGDVVECSTARAGTAAPSSTSCFATICPRASSRRIACRSMARARLGVRGRRLRHRAARPLGVAGEGGGGGHARHNGHSHDHDHQGRCRQALWCWSLFFAAAAALAPLLAVYVIQ